MNIEQARRISGEIELPKPAYLLGSGDMPAYSPGQVREAIVAALVNHEEREPLTAYELKKFCREHLGCTMEEFARELESTHNIKDKS